MAQKIATCEVRPADLRDVLILLPPTVTLIGGGIPFGDTMTLMFDVAASGLPGGEWSYTVGRRDRGIELQIGPTAGGRLTVNTLTGATLLLQAITEILAEDDGVILAGHLGETHEGTVQIDGDLDMPKLALRAYERLLRTMPHLSEPAEPDTTTLADNGKDFGWALAQMRAGHKVRRPHWGDAEWIEINAKGDLVNEDHSPCMFRDGAALIARDWSVSSGSAEA